MRERTRDEGQVRDSGEGCKKEEGVVGRHGQEGSWRGEEGGRTRPLVDYDGTAPPVLGTSKHAK